MPPIEGAIKAVQVNPRKSNRALAKEAGVNTHTMNRARRDAGESNLSPEREGQDGKVYRLPVKKRAGIHKEATPRVGEERMRARGQIINCAPRAPNSGVALTGGRHADGGRL
jgi:transposase-like protein